MTAGPPRAWRWALRAILFAVCVGLPLLWPRADEPLSAVEEASEPEPKDGPIITAKPASSFPEVATPEDSPARRALAERRIAATREKIAKVPELAAAWGPNGLEYARALDPEMLRKAGFLESEIEVQVEFKEALLEYYAKRPDGTRD